MARAEGFCSPIMSVPAHEQRVARARQMQADVLVHEVYEAGSKESNMSGSADFSVDSETFAAPSDAEIQHYTRLLNNPGQIQAHGALLVVDEKDGLKIKAASSNCSALLNRTHEQLLWGYGGSVPEGEDDKVDVSKWSSAETQSKHSSSSSCGWGPEMAQPMTLLDLFDEKQTIETALTLKNLDLANPVTVNISKVCEGDLGGAVNLILSRGENNDLLVDIEALDPTENAFVAHQKVRAAVDRLHQLTTVQELCEEVCASFKEMYNYNRVMVYRFHEDLHGEVVAERLDQDHDAVSYLGLHYPATDLPQRTRDQLKAHHVRTLIDAHAPHADIVMARKDVLPSSINLGASTLRRAHKCHLEYLENMGVTATIGVAVVVHDQLWGVVVGHHWSPKFVSYQMRMAGDFLAQAFSMRISSLLDKESHQMHRDTLDLHAKLCNLMVGQGLNPGLRLRGLVSGSPSLLDLVPRVCGAAVVYSGKISTVGQVPGLEVLKQMAEAIDEHWLASTEGREARAWDRISLLVRDARDLNECAGVLAVPVLEDGQLLFLRPELSMSIRWAGDPATTAVREKMSGALHPRASFEIYTDSVRGQCAPWNKRDLDAAVLPACFALPAPRPALLPCPPALAWRVIAFTRRGRRAERRQRMALERTACSPRVAYAPSALALCLPR